MQLRTDGAGNIGKLPCIGLLTGKEDPLDTEHIVVLPDIQIRGQLGGGGNDVEVAHGAVCADAPAAKILPKAVKMVQRLFDILSLDIGAFSLDGLDIALLHQQINGLPHRHAADVVCFAKLVLAAHAALGRPFAVLNIFDKNVLQLVVFCNGRRCIYHITAAFLKRVGRRYGKARSAVK